MNLPKRPNKEDEALFVEFYDEAVLDPVATSLAGVKQYKDKTYIRIQTDSYNTLEIPERHSEDLLEYSDRRRFPDSYALYQSKNSEQRIGTPLSLLPGMTPAKIKNYENADIYSLEQIASSPDQRITKFMGGYDDKKQAIKYLEEAKEKHSVEMVEKKFEASQAQLDAQAEQIKEQKELIEKLMAAQKNPATKKGAAQPQA